MRRTKFAGAVATAGVVIGMLVSPAVSAAPAPGKEACKNGGFQDVPGAFKNQGQCVKAANEAAKAGQPFPPPPVGTS